MESHRGLLDALAQRVDHDTRRRHESEHTRLVNLTHVLLDRAAMRGRRMEDAVRQWEDFDRHLERARERLHRLEQLVPAGTSPSSTLEEIRRQISENRRLHDNFMVDKPVLYQVGRDAEKWASYDKELMSLYSKS